MNKELLKLLFGEELSNTLEETTPMTNIPKIKGRTYPEVSGIENIVEGLVRSGENRRLGKTLKTPISKEDLIVSAGVNEPGHSSKPDYKYMDEKGNIKDIEGRSQNLGIDLASARKPGEKLDLGAAFSGKVVDVVDNNSRDNKYGKSVIVKSDLYEQVDGKSYPIYYRYSHLDDINVKKGDSLKVGDSVGRMGGSGSGRSDTYPVHLDLRPYIETEKGRIEVNPKRVFEKAGKAEGEIENYVLAPSKEKVIDPVKKQNYDKLSFNEAFEQAMEDKGEGKTFEWKGKKFLLEREDKKPKLEKLEGMKKELKPEPVEAEPKKESFKDMLQPYADKMDDIVEEETESMKDFDPREMQLQRLIDRGEDLVSKYDKFKDGGRKYQDGSVYGPSDEELMGKKKSFEELAREYASLTKPEESPTSEEMNPVVEETKVEEKTPRIRDAGESPDMLEQMSADAEYKAAEIAPEVQKPPSELSKKESKPMTMEDLENRYMELMKASESERKTAQWATAATQIASMLDKFSARPVGIQPINFEANINPVQMKELMAIGRMKGLGQEDRMTAYQQATLRERKKARELAEKKLEMAMNKAPEEKLTEAQKAVDRNYGKEYADYIAAGGSKTVESDLSKLSDITKEMEQNKDMFSGPLDTLVEYTGGFDTTRAAVNPRLQDIKSRLEQIIQQDLRTTLGAQFTEKEGKQFLERSFDPKLGYEANKKRLDDFIKMVKSRAEARKKAAQYFEEKGTLKGFKGTDLGLVEGDLESGKTLVKKQYSPSRNKTKLIYSDGTEEVVDGRQ